MRLKSTLSKVQSAEKILVHPKCKKIFVQLDNVFFSIAPCVLLIFFLDIISLLFFICFILNGDVQLLPLRARKRRQKVMYKNNTKKNAKRDIGEINNLLVYQKLCRIFGAIIMITIFQIWSPGDTRYLGALNTTVKSRNTHTQYND